MLEDRQSVKPTEVYFLICEIFLYIAQESYITAMECKIITKMFL